MSGWGDVQGPIGDVVGWTTDVIGAIGNSNSGNASADQAANSQPVNVIVEVPANEPAPPPGVNPWLVGGAVVAALLFLR